MILIIPRRNQRFFSKLIITTFFVLFQIFVCHNAFSQFKAPVPVKTPVSVQVNRKIPAGALRPDQPLVARLSSQPTDEEIYKLHVFEEALVPAAGNFDAQENKALVGALVSFHQRNDANDFSAIIDFLNNYPASRWKGAILTNIGLVYRHTGYFTRAIEAFKAAWDVLKKEDDQRVVLLADRALAELICFYSWLGDVEKIEKLQKEIEHRDIIGPGRERIYRSYETVEKLKQRPAESFKCGVVALNQVIHSQEREKNLPELLSNAKSPTTGFSLLEIFEMAKELKLNYQMAYRKPGSPVITNSIIHWKLNHYSALMSTSGGYYRFEDPTVGTRYGQQFWLTTGALEEEASGYFLVPKGPLPKGWRVVEENEGRTVFGKCNNVVTGSNNVAFTSEDIQVGTCSGEGGMPYSNVFAAALSLHISDRPVFHSPPRGPAVAWDFHYIQRDSWQLANAPYSNVGQQWIFSFLSYVEDDPNISDANVLIYLPGGGVRRYLEFDSITKSFIPEIQTKEVLVRISDLPNGCYELRHPDGSKEVYSRPDGNSGASRKVFLTYKIDALGDTLTILYDNSLRIIAVEDAIGQVDSVAYDVPGDNYKISSITDPFGRQATLEYDAQGRLLRITDVIGLSSTFTYGTSNFITSMTTPYGTTKYIFEEIPSTAYRSVETIFPLGERERVEFKTQAAGISASEDSSNVPYGGMNINNMMLDIRNTFFWDKKAMKEAPGDYTKALIYHWLAATGTENIVTPMLESMKLPLENRIWYNYEGQGLNASAAVQLMSSQPSIVGRVIKEADGTSLQYFNNTYNFLGKVLTATDPVGRKTSFVYEPNFIDVKEVLQTNGNENEILTKITNDTVRHLPLTITDASGQTTEFTYNENGQPLTITNALGETKTMEYDGSGYLIKATGAIPGSNYSFTYDGFGRPRTITDPDNYTLTYDYDAMDRPTLITYPDETYEQIVYNRLDATDFRDRQGRWSHVTYDSLQRPSIMQDALGRISQFIWCSCGSLSEIIDPLKNVTLFTRDLQGRVTSKTYADGSKMNYTYENTTSRLKKVTDAKGQKTQYYYYLDDNIKQVDYLNATVVTPSVSFNYDSIYNRLLSLTDGTGTTKYAYHPITAIPSLGAGMLATVDGPLDNDIISLSYDSIGRLSSRSINGVASSMVYDALNRMTANNNALGTFNYSYVDQTKRLSSVTYPNGQKTTYTYFGKNDDFLVKQITNKTQGGTILSRFKYEYNNVDQITKWTQKTLGSEKYFDLSYDQADELLAATQKKTSNDNLVKRYAYHYDPAGNRTTEQIDNMLNSAIHNSLNQVTATAPGGQYRIKGSLSEFSKVSLSNSTNGAVDSASVDENNVFTGSINVVPGKNIISVTATDYSGNNNSTILKTKPTITGGLVHTYTYDYNGNTLTDATDSVLITYGWDAADRLVKITRCNLIKLAKLKVTEFVYDGYGRRIAEKINGVVIKRWLWCAMELCEERDAVGGNVTKRFFPQGEEINGVDYFFSKDHLGSIREMTTSSGTIVVRYDYDPYGRRTKTEGILEADFGFTGHYYHISSGLHLALFRAYSASEGRWLNQDPIKEDAGLNLYSYTLNNSINNIDPRGLVDWDLAANGSAQLLLGGVASLFGGVLFASNMIPAIETAPLNLSLTKLLFDRSYSKQVKQGFKSWGKVSGIGLAISSANFGYERMKCGRDLLAQAFRTSPLKSNSNATNNSIQKPILPPMLPLIITEGEMFEGISSMKY